MTLVEHIKQITCLTETALPNTVGTENLDTRNIRIQKYVKLADEIKYL
jgi:hypothetical protein